MSPNYNINYSYKIGNPSCVALGHKHIWEHWADMGASLVKYILAYKPYRRIELINKTVYSFMEIHATYVWIK